MSIGYHSILNFLIQLLNKQGYNEESNYLVDHFDILEKGVSMVSSCLLEIDKVSHWRVDSGDKVSYLINHFDFLDTSSAMLLISIYEKPIIKKNQTGGSKKKNHLKQNIKQDFKTLRKGVQQIGSNSNFYDTKIGDELQTFKESYKKYQDQDPFPKDILKINEIPKYFYKTLSQEYKIPLSLNDILLIGLSMFPTIGWIFDIFIIFRSIIENRYIFAILLIINCYQYFIYKLLSFGILGMDFSPIIKLFYIAPYINKEFTYENIKAKINEFLEKINIGFNQEVALL